MEHQEIEAATLREWLDTGKQVNVLDVRPEHERKEWYIPGSIHFDAYDQLKQNDPDALTLLNLDASMPVVTVCAGGKTSLIASRLLRNSGYEAYNLQGGMKGWSTSWNTATTTFDTFKIIQFRRTGKGCLSYLITSEGEAMVVDASLSVDVYQKILQQESAVLKDVIDTHIHADHLSRTRELAEAYGLRPSVPSNDKLNYAFSPIKDGTVFSVGKTKIKAIHTPGHTVESTCYLVGDRVLLTGDTLFTNGVGRPDLKANQQEVTEKARLLYHSLKKLLQLDRSTVAMPGHTSQPVPFDNKAIQANLEQVVSATPILNEDEETFVRSLLARIPATPENYLSIVERNISGDFSDVDPIDLEVGANRCAISWVPCR